MEVPLISPWNSTEYSNLTPVKSTIIILFLLVTRDPSETNQGSSVIIPMKSVVYSYENMDITSMPPHIILFCLMTTFLKLLSYARPGPVLRAN
jgi:hypothetical protein